MQGDFSKEKIQINLARLKKGGEHFEIVIDPDAAIKFKESGEGSMREIMKAEDIFSDAKKGNLASSELMQTIFQTSEPKKVAEIILKEGEIQLTSEHRQKVRDEKTEKIINIIQMNSIDPKTNLPHPVKRIKLAFEEAKVKVDEYKTAEQQVEEIVKKLQPIIPIRFEQIKFLIRIPGISAGKMHNDLLKYGKILEDEWLNDGSWKVKLEMPAGLKVEFIELLNNKTHGSIDIEELK